MDDGNRIHEVRSDAESSIHGSITFAKRFTNSDEYI